MRIKTVDAVFDELVLFDVMGELLELAARLPCGSLLVQFADQLGEHQTSQQRWAEMLALEKPYVVLAAFDALFVARGVGLVLDATVDKP